MIRKSMAILVVAASLTGCAHRVNLALTPSFDEAPKSESLAAIAPPLTMRTGDVADKRPDTTRISVFKQGIHTYNVYGERPLEDAIVDGLRSLFRQAGHTWVDGPDARVSVGVQILNIQTARNAGFVKVGATSSVQIRLDFIETRGGRTIHSEVYNGTDQRDQAMVGLMGMVKDSVDQAIVNCIASVGRDEKLAAALRAMAGP
jgi:hypothetical protein